MAKERIRRRESDGTEDEFYESIPATMEPIRYRDDPVRVERDDSNVSGWVLAALLIVGLLLLLLIIGRLGSLSASLNSGPTGSSGTQTQSQSEPTLPR